MSKWFKNWRGTSNKSDKLNVIIAFASLLLSLIGIVVAIWGVLPQLRELNARGRIITAFTRIGEVTEGTSVISFDLNPIIFNVGYGDTCFDTEQWRVSIDFEDNVVINKYDKAEWPLSRTTQRYEHNDSAKLLCAINDYHQGGTPDNVGEVFSVTIPKRFSGYFPLALIVSHGYRSPTLYRQAFFDYKTQYIKYRQIDLAKNSPYDFSNPSNLVILVN